MLTEERAREIRSAVRQLDRITQRRIDAVINGMVAWRTGSIFAGFILFADLAIELSHQNFHNAGVVMIFLGLLWFAYQVIGHIYTKRADKIRKEHQEQIEAYVKELQDIDADEDANDLNGL